MPYTKLKRFVSTTNGSATALLLNAVTALTTGRTITVPGDTVVKTLRWWIYTPGAAVGTVLIEGSYDGTNWGTLASQAVAAAGLLTGTISGPFKYYRARVSAYTSGTYSVAAEVVYEP